MELQLHLVLMVLLAAVLHASWNAVVKSAGERFLSFTAIRGAGTVIGLLAAIFVPFPAASVWPYLIAGIVIHNCYYVTLLQAYRFGDLSHVYPLARGIAPLTVAVLAAVFVGEVPNVGGLAGITLVSAGVISLMFSSPGTGQGGLKPVLLAIVTGLFIAGYTVVDGVGIRLGESALGYIVWLNAGEGLPFIVTALVWKPRQAVAFIRGNWRRSVGTGAIMITAYGLVLFALSQGAMAHVSALRETSVLFAAVIGAAFLGEPFGWRRIAAAAVIVTGVVMLQVA